MTRSDRIQHYKELILNDGLCFATIANASWCKQCRIGKYGNCNTQAAYERAVYLLKRYYPTDYFEVLLTQV